MAVVEVRVAPVGWPGGDGARYHDIAETHESTPTTLAIVKTVCGRSLQVFHLAEVDAVDLGIKACTQCRRNGHLRLTPTQRGQTVI